jgi:WD40 repeat protein
MSIAFGPEDRWLASGGKDGAIRVWDLDPSTSNEHLEVDVSAELAYARRDAVSPRDVAEEASTETVPPDSTSILSSEKVLGTTVDVFADRLAPVPRAILSGLTDVTDGMTDGSLYVALGDAGEIGFGHAIEAWSLEDGSTRPLADRLSSAHQSPVTALALSSDGERLVSGASDSRVAMWDLGSGEPIWIDDEGHGGERVEAVAFASPERIVSASSDWKHLSGDLIAWSGDDGSELIRLIEQNVAALASDPAGGGVIIATKAGEIAWWDAKSPDFSRQQSLGEFELTSIAAQPDGRMIAAGDAEGVVHVLDTSTEDVFQINAHRQRIHALAIDPSGRLLLTGSADGAAKAWDLTTGRPIALMLEHVDDVVDVAFIDERQAVTASFDGTVRLWSLEGATR